MDITEPRTVIVIRLGSGIPDFMNQGKSGVWITDIPGSTRPENWLRSKIGGNHRSAKHFLDLMAWTTLPNDNESRAYKNQLCEYYASRFHHVNPDIDTTFSIYVFELLGQDSALYVGQTSKTVDERMEEHRRGRYYPYREKLVGKRITALEPSGGKAVAFSTYNAKVLEALTCEKIRRAGYDPISDMADYRFGIRRPDPADYGATNFWIRK
jgi:predicted GIY-YIG superfamily endonuclease